MALERPKALVNHPWLYVVLLRLPALPRAWAIIMLAVAAWVSLIAAGWVALDLIF